MKQLLSILGASVLILTAASAVAAEPAKDVTKDAPAAKAASAKLEKPAGVDPAAWAKMSDAEKQKAVDAAAKPKAGAADAPKKKEKKGGC